MPQKVITGVLILFLYTLTIHVDTSNAQGTEIENRFSDQIKPGYVFTWDVTNFTHNDQEVTSPDSFFYGIKNESVIQFSTDIHPSDINVLDPPPEYNTTFMLSNLFNITIDGTKVTTFTNNTVELLKLLIVPTYIKYDNGTETDIFEIDRDHEQISNFYPKLNLSGSFGWSFNQVLGFRKTFEVNSYGGDAELLIIDLDFNYTESVIGDFYGNTYSPEIKQDTEYRWQVTKYTENNTIVDHSDGFYEELMNGSILTMSTDINVSNYIIQDIPNINQTFPNGDLFNVTIDSTRIENPSVGVYAVVSYAIYAYINVYDTGRRDSQLELFEQDLDESQFEASETAVKVNTSFFGGVDTFSFNKSSGIMLNMTSAFTDSMNTSVYFEIHYMEPEDVSEPITTTTSTMSSSSSISSTAASTSTSSDSPQATSSTTASETMESSTAALNYGIVTFLMILVYPVYRFRSKS